MFKRLEVGRMALWLFGATATATQSMTGAGSASAGRGSNRRSLGERVRRRLFAAMAIVGALALSPVTPTAQAAPIPITVQLQTDTAAVAESTADVHSDTSPPSASPLATSSVVVGVTDFASGGAIAVNGLLSTSAEAASATGFASGLGSSRYQASFSRATDAVVQLAFDASDFTDPSGSSLATAILLILNDGVTLLEEVITLSGLYEFTVAFTSGLSQSIDLILTSEAYTLTGGSAANVATVSFGVLLIPEPGSLAIALVALVALGTRRAGTRRSGVRAVPTVAVPA